MTVTPDPFTTEPKRRPLGPVAVVLLALVAGIVGSVLVYTIWPPVQTTTVVHDTVYADAAPEHYSAPITPAPTTDPDAPTMQPPAPTEIKDNSLDPSTNPISTPPVAPIITSDHETLPVEPTTVAPSVNAIPTTFVFCDILWTTPNQQTWLIKTQMGSLLISIDDADGMHFGETYQADVVMLTNSVGTIDEHPTFVGVALPNQAGIC